MPFIKSELKFSVVGESLRGSSNLTRERVDCQYIISRIKCCLILKKTSFIGKVRKRDMCRPAINELLPDIVRDKEGPGCELASYELVKSDLHVVQL